MDKKIWSRKPAGGLFMSREPKPEEEDKMIRIIGTPGPSRANTFHIRWCSEKSVQGLVKH